MEIIQILLILFALFAFSRVVLRARDRKLGRREFVFWSIVWIGVLLVGFLPNITTFFADIFGVGRGIDLIVYLSIIVLFYFIFRLYIKVESIKKDVIKIVREFSYQGANKKIK